MKKFITISVTLLMIGLLSACQTSSNTAEKSGTRSVSTAQSASRKKHTISSSASEKTSSQAEYAIAHHAQHLDQVKLGMTKGEIKALVGRPHSYSENTWGYVEGDLYFQQGRLTGGTPEQVRQLTDNSIDSQPVSPQAQGMARSFAHKPIIVLKNKNPAVFPRKTVGDASHYTWTTHNPNVGTLIRVDTPNLRTAIYLSDQNAENGIGGLVYEDRTITANND